MKKFLLSMAAVAMMAGSADAMYLIGQPAGEWSPAIGIEMEEVDGGWQWTGYTGLSDYFAFATQLGNPGDWDNFNANYRLSPNDGDGTYAATGTYGMHLGEPGCAFRGLDAEATYIVKEVNGEYTLTVITDGQIPPEPVNQWSLIGAFGGWAEDIDMVEVASGVWTVSYYGLNGDFKFRNNHTWEENIGAMEYFEIDYDCELPIAYNGNNFSIINEEGRKITLTLNLNENTLLVKGIAPRNLALRGSFADWEFEWSYLFMEYGEFDVLNLYLDGVEAEWEFKVANSNWSEEYTTGNTEMEAGVVYPVYTYGGNMGTDKTYSEVLMTLNLNDMTFSFTGTAIDTAVAEIEIENGKARYFNLQGVEITNPTEGLYIRVANGKSEKILVK